MENKRDMLGKGLHVLTHLGDHPDGVSVSELARETGLPVSTTHRLLATLVADGYAAVDSGTHLYRVALRVFELSQKAAATWGSTRVREELTAMTEETGESALMGAIDGTEFVYLEHVEGPHRVRVKGNLGTRGPLHCTALGKLLLAVQPAGERDRILDELTLTRYTPTTITTMPRLREELHVTAERGYAVTDQEYEPEIRSIAVPVTAAEQLGSTIAVCLTAPVYRTSLDRLRDWLPVLRETGRKIALYRPGGHR
ncbi:IclR family transcriptional regulator [Haloactinopolyspora alba]|uniref:IclR family transcriptional regulator n=1 Tax=Haloactinopolyspora alba TaxID=648780 RepID=A0A2P8E9J4_9ACTN|nr:IclR family transcriptional regulator [Haloactinopolyspora alba]PSL06124.1 IclR family transcriptional regulator [Haloactinopolyspora alba]